MIHSSGDDRFIRNQMCEDLLGIEQHFVFALAENNPDHSLLLLIQKNFL